LKKETVGTTAKRPRKERSNGQGEIHKG
jgi:hypothetical protein